jgi:dsDNA-binding SOS-regulon protein
MHINASKTEFTTKAFEADRFVKLLEIVHYLQNCENEKSNKSNTAEQKYRPKNL